jgi:hypothetical protein
MLMGLSYMAKLSVVIEISLGAIKVAGGDKAKGALETYENKDEDNVGANRADEHDKIEDAHEQYEVCYGKPTISRCSKGRTSFSI